MPKVRRRRAGGQRRTAKLTDEERSRAFALLAHVAMYLNGEGEELTNVASTERAAIERALAAARQGRRHAFTALALSSGFASGSRGEISEEPRKRCGTVAERRSRPTHLPDFNDEETLRRAGLAPTPEPRGPKRPPGSRVLSVRMLVSERYLRDPTSREVRQTKRLVDTDALPPPTTERSDWPMVASAPGGVIEGYPSPEAETISNLLDVERLAQRDPRILDRLRRCTRCERWYAEGNLRAGPFCPICRPTIERERERDRKRKVRSRT